MAPEEENALELLALEAQRLAKSAKPIEAEELARKVPASDHLTDFMHEKVVAFIEVARAYGVGNAQRAASILREAEALSAGLRQGGVWHEGDALGQIGDAWTTLGNREEAVRVFIAGVAAIEAARLLDDGSYGALARLARRLQAAGEMERASAIRRKLPEALAKARGWYE